MRKIELLSPAGDMERLKMSVLYGADAVYLAGTSFGMRSFAGNFTDEQLRSTDEQTIVDFLMLMESPRTNGEMFDPESGWFTGNEWADGFIFPSDTVSHATYHYHFMLETLSEDYYRYLNTVSSYSILGGTFVGEPTHIHTNIHGGLGIVGSYSTTARKGDKAYQLP